MQQIRSSSSSPQQNKKHEDLAACCSTAVESGSVGGMTRSLAGVHHDEQASKTMKRLVVLEMKV